MAGNEANLPKKIADILSFLFAGLAFFSLCAFLAPFMLYLNYKDRVKRHAKNPESDLYKKNKIKYDVIRFQLFPFIAILVFFSISAGGTYASRQRDENANTILVLIISMLLVACFLTFLISWSLHISISMKIADLTENETEKQKEYKKKKVRYLVLLIFSALFFPILLFLINKFYGTP